MMFAVSVWGATDDSCNGDLTDTLSSSDTSWNGSFQVRESDDPNDYIYFDITQNGLIDISANVGDKDKVYYFSVSKTGCGNSEVYTRTSSKNHSKTGISVSNGDKIYIRMDAVGYGNNDRRNLDLSVTFTVAPTVPTINDQAFNIPENSTSIGTVDATNATSYSVVPGGTGDSILTINSSTGLITVKSGQVLDYENLAFPTHSYTLFVKATKGGVDSLPATIKVNLTDVPGPTVTALQTFSIVSGSVNGTAVATGPVLTTGTTPTTFTINSGTPFTIISNTGVIKVANSSALGAVGTVYTLTVGASNSEGADSKTVQITVIPQMVTVGFSQAVYQTAEDLNLPFGSSGNMLMTVQLSEAVGYDVTVNFTTQDGTAVGITAGGEDYISQNGSVTIPAGETTTPVTMYIIHDQPIELDESFTVNLSTPQPSSSVQLGLSTATATILEQTTAPICYTDNFDTTLDSKWRTLFSSGGFTPAINAGNLKLTPGKKNIATAVTKDYEFPSKENLIIVEFKHYAYGGCFEESTPQAGLGAYGADGVVAVLYDSAVGASPIPGGYGGSMGYAQNTAASPSKPGFQGGWLGLGLDEYGNFANPTEGRVNPVAGTGGFHTNAAVIRGDGSGTTGYEFLAEAYGNPPITTPLAPLVDYTNPPKLQGDIYQMTVDARSNQHLYLTLKRDINDGNGYQVVINKFDAKLPVYNQSTTPDFVRFALTSGTGGGCNAHEIDDLKVWGNCSVYSPSLSGAFRVTEDISNASWTSKWPKKYLATKVAPLNKRYCVLAGTSANDSATPLTSAINVDVNMTDNNGYMQQLFANLAIPAASSVTCFDANISMAAKNMQFIITKHDDQAIKSFSDTFAIRPKTYVIDVNGTALGLLSGTTYKLDLNATTTVSDANVSGYTTTLGTVTPNTSASQIFAPSMPTCPVSGSNPLSISFTQGSASLSSFSYNDVMDINVTVVDGNWTATDQLNGGCTLGTDDINIIPVGCLIKATKQLRFVPHHFDLNSSVRNVNNGSFTYLSNPYTAGNDFNMSGLLDLNITAKNAMGGTTQNYNTLCYAKAKDINITYTPVAVTNLSKISSQYLHDAIVIGDVNRTLGTNIDVTGVTKDIFTVDHNGSAVLHFKINYDRNETKLVDKFDFNITKIDVNTTDEVNATTIGNQNVTFVYGRVIPRDVRVFGDVAFSANSWYEIYNVSSLAGTTFLPSRNEALWYINSLHIDPMYGDANVTVVVTGANPANVTPNATNGVESYAFGAQTPPYSAKAHIDTDAWLWYGANALPYQDPDGAHLDCLTHPCFNINVVPAVGATGSAKTSNESTKSSKTTSRGTGWHSTTDYAPAIR